MLPASAPATSIAFANSATVGEANRARNGGSRSKSRLIRAITWIASSEWPPRPRRNCPRSRRARSREPRPRSGTASPRRECAARHIGAPLARRCPAPAGPCDRPCRWRSAAAHPGPRTPPEPCSRATPAAAPPAAPPRQAPPRCSPPHKQRAACRRGYPRAPRPPLRAPQGSGRAPPRPRPARSGSRGSSPDDRPAREIRSLHRRGSGRDRR